MKDASISFRLIDTGWDRELEQALRADTSNLRLVCPFIKLGAAERLLRQGRPPALQVITRFNLHDFYDGVSDTAALRLLLASGAQIRGVKNLHAKLYLFGQSRVIVTSANLTDAALLRNHEFGFVAEDAGIVDRCGQYFANLWGRAGEDLSAARLADWERRLSPLLAGGARPSPTHGLGDEGVDVNIPAEPVVLPVRVSDAPQSFVKFFGQSHDRADRSMLVLEEVQRSGSHWACTYPKEKRPRRVRDGAVMFMGRMVRDENDIMIYGRAVGEHYVGGRDDATSADVQRRPWKVNWPHYIRVHHAEFIAGSLGNGISLNELMEALRADAFVTTQRNAARGQGNTDPRKAYLQQAAVQLSPQGSAWLNEQIERVYAEHGRLAPVELERLDWPDTP